MRRKRKNQKRQRKAKKDEDVPTEILSQEEIDQLLTVINNRDSESEDFIPVSDCRKIKIYDFERPCKFSKEQIRIMSILQETFARHAASDLTNRFNLPCHIHVASVDQLNYDECIDSIPSPAILAVIDLHPPTRKEAIIEIDPAIFFAVINRAFGGDGGCIEPPQELTRLEWLVMIEVINKLLESMRDGWSKIIDLTPTITRTDTDPQFLNVSPPSEMTVLVTLEAKIGDVGGMLNINYPYSCLKEIIDKLSAEYLWGSHDASLKNYELSSCEDIPVELIAEIFKREYSIGNILKWKNEELLLPLRPRMPDTCYLKIGDRRVWYCEILEDNKWFSKKIKLKKLAESSAESEGRMKKISSGDSVASRALLEAEITISVELGRTALPIKEILSLGEGSIVELDRLAGEPVDIKANGIFIAKGEVVVVDDNFGIRVIEIMEVPNQSNESEEP
jgi:flagellar motor switch protein FliM